jgi:uncharacterized coiled-coil protein SlyX
MTSYPKSEFPNMTRAKTVESEAIVIDFSEDKAINDFLNSQKPSTKHTYSTYMKRLCEFSNQNGKEILADSEQWITKIFEFQKWLKSKGYSDCYIQSCLGSVRGFFVHHRITLAFNRQERRKLMTNARKTTDYHFSREEIFRMGEVANLRERYVLYCGKSVGLRSIDFVTFTFADFRRLNLNEDCPIPLGERNTVKENVKAYPFLDPDAVSVIRTLLEANKDKADTDRVFPYEKEELSVILRALAKKSNIDSHGARTRFHCLRKYLIDRLSAYASESQWKQIVGKKIEESAYISTEMLRGIYHRAMKDISVTTNGFKTKKIEQLESALVDAQKTIANQQTTINTLTARIQQLESGQNTMQKEIANHDLDILEIQKKVGIKPKPLREWE